MWLLVQFSAGCTTSIAGSEWRHEAKRESMKRRGPTLTKSPLAWHMSAAPVLRKKSICTSQGATFASDADVTLLLSSRSLKVSSPTVYAQDRTAPPITAFYPSYYSRRRHAVSVAGSLVTRGIECRGAVPAQTVGVLLGTPSLIRMDLANSLNFGTRGLEVQILSPRPIPSIS